MSPIKWMTVQLCYNTICKKEMLYCHQRGHMTGSDLTVSYLITDNRDICSFQSIYWESWNWGALMGADVQAVCDLILWSLVPSQCHESSGTNEIKSLVGGTKSLSEAKVTRWPNWAGWMWLALYLQHESTWYIYLICIYGDCKLCNVLYQSCHRTCKSKFSDFSLTFPWQKWIFPWL